MADTFQVTRSIMIHARPETIMAEIADLKRHESWSPFSKPDPKMKLDHYEGAPSVGQTRTFAGGRSGSGRIRIDRVEPDRVEMTLVMTAPVKATNTVIYRLYAELDGTAVTWTMTGPMTLMGRIMKLFIDTDAMCGKMFEQGLAELKVLLERGDEKLAA